MNEDFPIPPRDGILIVGLISFLGSVLGAIPGRFLGRILILSSSHLLIAITHLIIGLLYKFGYHLESFIMIQIFIMWFYLGTGNVSFIYCGEACVDQAMGMVLGARWITEIVMSYTISFMLDSPLQVEYTFCVYAGLNVIAFIYFLFMKETRGKTVQQLEELYWTPAMKQHSVELMQVMPMKDKLGENTEDVSKT